MRDDHVRAGLVTSDEAKEILVRFINSHFRKRSEAHGRDCARISIPANPTRDDDIRMSAFIARAERLETAALALLEAMAGGPTADMDHVIGNLRHELEQGTPRPDPQALTAQKLGALLYEEFERDDWGDVDPGMFANAFDGGDEVDEDYARDTAGLRRVLARVVRRLQKGPLP